MRMLSRISSAFGVLVRGSGDGVSLSLSEVVRRMRGGDFGRPMSGPRPTRSYSQVAAVYGCVKAKADALGMLPLMVSTVDDEVLESGPLVDLAERPNEAMTGRQFRRHTSAYLDLFGRVHWWLRLGPGGRPLAVAPVNPLQMHANRDTRTGELLNWKYRPFGRMSTLELTLSVEEVHTIVDPDFEDDDPLAGLSPRKAAATAIAQYWKADLANERSLDNDMKLGSIISPDEPVTEDQWADFVRHIRDQNEGFDRRHASLFTSRKVNVANQQATFKDMEFPELKRMGRADICAAFNVPPSVVGFFEDSNYAHAESAEQAFWIKTILPLAARLAEEWDAAVLSRFEGDRSLALAEAQRRAATRMERTGFTYRRAAKAARRARAGVSGGRRRFYAWFDASEVPAVQAARLATAQSAKEWHAMGVPLNQILAATDAPFEAVPWGDTVRVPIGTIDITEESGLPGHDDPPGDGETDLLDPPEGGRGGGRRAAGERVERVGGDGGGVPEKTRARLHQQWRASWAGLEKTTRGRVRRHFNDLRKETLKRLAATMPKVEALRKSGKLTGDLVGGVQRDVIGQILFDLVEANERMRVRVGPLIREAYRLGGEQVMQEAAQATGSEAEPFNISDPHVAGKLRQRTVEIVDLNRRHQRRLRASLAEGMDNGESLADLTERVKTQFNQVDKRAATIARTEVGAAVEEARAEGRRQAGVPLKSWLSSRKETGRESHLHTERATMAEPIGQDEDFVIAGTGVRAPHPRATGLPEHDINCGCTTIARFPAESARAMAARYQQRGFLTYEQMLARDRAKANGGTA